MSENKELTEYMLTTVDNPYNPFTQWDLWYNFDQHMHYCTCEYLGRVTEDSEGFTPEEVIRETNRAIDSIVKNDPFNRYRKVSRDNFDSIINETNRNVEEFSTND